jgi:hypothetical protein
MVVLLVYPLNKRLESFYFVLAERGLAKIIGKLFEKCGSILGGLLPRLFIERYHAGA